MLNFMKVNLGENWAFNVAGNNVICEERRNTSSLKNTCVGGYITLGRQRFCPFRDFWQKLFLVTDRCDLSLRQAM